MCRFNPAEKTDKENYVFVEANITELCEAAVAQGELPISLSNSIPTDQSAEALRQRLMQSELFPGNLGLAKCKTWVF